MTYANRIGYVDSPLYYYCQRQDSITSNNSDKTLGVIESWKRVLENANLKYIDEAIFAVCRSISIFIDFKPMYADKFIEFIRKNKFVIQKNQYYRLAVKNGQIKDLMSLVLIPKKIHYCWFGKGPKTELALRCMETWKRKLPDYEIIEWNETNCNINETQYVKEAYETKKWAFVADYFRLKAIYEYGGLYLDTDVEITDGLEKFRYNEVFFAFETNKCVNTGIFGAVKGAEVFKKCIEEYKVESFIKVDSTLNYKTIGSRLTKILVDEYDFLENGKQQVLNDNIVICPANILTLNVYDGRNCAIHHYDASWWDVKSGPSWKEVVLKSYFREKLTNIFPNSKEIQVSIIIFWENNIDTLIETIKSMLASENFLRFEIIVVDDSRANGDTASFEFSINKKMNQNIRLIETKGIGFAAARNCGAKASQGKYLFFCNENIKVQDMWLDHLVYTLINSNAQLVSPCMIDHFNPSLVVYGMTCNNNFQFTQLLEKPKYISEIPIAGDNVLGITKETFEKIHGFNETFHEDGLENQELCFKAWIYGYKIVVNPSVEIKCFLVDNDKISVINSIYNILYFAFSHFSKERIYKIINILKTNHDFSEAAKDIKINSETIFNERNTYFNECEFTDDFFFEKFNISF